MQALPNEILDRILDFLHHDRQSLASCALASRVLLQTSRFHRFNGHWLVPKDAQKLAPLLAASPSLRHSIVSLQYTPTVLGFPNYDEKIMFQHLSSLRELDIYLDGIPMLASVLSTTTLTTLRVRGLSRKIGSSDIPIMLEALSAFPSIEELAFVDVRLFDGDRTQIRYPPPLSNLRKVCIQGGTCADAVAQWLKFAEPQPVYIVRYSVTASWNANDFADVSDALSQLVQALEVKFIPDGGLGDCLHGSRFTLDGFTNLHTCALRFALSEMCVSENRSLVWIPSIVAQLSSSRLRLLTISLVVDNVEDLRSLNSECAVRVLTTAYFEDMCVLDWITLGQALSSDRLPGLERVLLEGRGNRQGLEDHIKDNCPELYARGILSLVTVKERATWLF